MLSEHITQIGSNGIKVNPKGCSHLRREDVFTDALYFLSSKFEVNLYGLTKYYAASSCQDIVNRNPERKSGYYWIKNDCNTQNVYCNYSN